jgi:hypothetical protein
MRAVHTCNCGLTEGVVTARGRSCIRDTPVNNPDRISSTVACIEKKKFVRYCKPLFNEGPYLVKKLTDCQKTTKLCA